MGWLDYSEGHLKFKLENDHEGIRIDQVLASLLKVSRSYVQSLITRKLVTLNGQTVKPSAKFRAGQIIELVVPPPENSQIEAEPIPLRFVMDDPDFVIVNKPRNMIMHPVGPIRSGTLVNALLYHFSEFDAGNTPLRPGIVHRLDKDTSGLVIVAKNSRSLQLISDLFKQRLVKKKYYALIKGALPNRIVEVNEPIGRDPDDRKLMKAVPWGRSSLTVFRQQSTFNNRKCSLIIAEPLTGRTHQIRAHLRHLGLYLVGDSFYSRTTSEFDSWITGQALTAFYLRFPHPVYSEKIVEVEIPLPEDIAGVLNNLAKDQI